MRIAMFTNAYPPHVGGVASSVSIATDKMKAKGHAVKVVAPSFDDKVEKKDDKKVIYRLQSLKNVYGSDFSVPLPFSIELKETLDNFNPDIIHSHYPFLLGDIALRYGALKNIPVVFTHHTRYEAYEGLFPIETETFDRFVTELSTGYSNLCNHVIVPTKGMLHLLRQNGVKTTTSVIPTGIDTQKFKHGSGKKFRKKWRIPEKSLVIGYVGRLAEEKNLLFWAEAVCELIQRNKDTYAAVIGAGESDHDIRKIFSRYGLRKKLIMPGVLDGVDLIDAYHAFDIFGFTSERETQGIVIVEALAAGCPVVALDVRCVRDVVSDNIDGILVKNQTTSDFRKSLEWISRLSRKEYKRMCQKAIRNSRKYDVEGCIDRTLELYSSLVDKRGLGLVEKTGWLAIAKMLKRDCMLWKNRIKAVVGALVTSLKRK